MKRQELIVLLMIAEGREPDLYQIFDRALLRERVLHLIELELITSTRSGPAVLNGRLAITDRARTFLEAVDTVPLPESAWSMRTITGD